MTGNIIMARRGLGLLAVGALVVLLGADEGDCSGSPQINNTVIVCASADGGGKCGNESAAGPDTGASISGGLPANLSPELESLLNAYYIDLANGVYQSSGNENPVVPYEPPLTVNAILPDGTEVFAVTSSEHHAEVQIMLADD